MCLGLRQSFFLHAIESANCGTQRYELFAARADGAEGFVVALTPGTELFVNGGSQGMLGDGQVWQGAGRPSQEQLGMAWSG